MSPRAPRIVAFGGVTQDVHLMGPALRHHTDPRTHGDVEQFPLGAKLELDAVAFGVGGGASNAAVTFARQGFPTALAARVGRDLPGEEVRRTMLAEGVDVRRLTVDETLGTAYSVILLADNGERTVLVYRGAAHHFGVAELVAGAPYEADWFYVSALGGDLVLLRAILDLARSLGARVALNPGQAELDQRDALLPLLDGVEILLANRDELACLYGGFTPLETIAAAVAEGACRHVVLTDGPDGCWATDGARIVRAGVYRDVEVVDRLGAGDAFCSGFTAAIARGDDLADAISLGAANSTAVVGRIGAKAGILRREDPVLRMEVREVTVPLQAAAANYRG